MFLVNVLMLGGIHASRGWIARTRQAQAHLSAIRSALVDAETGQRGFLLTGRADYLLPFETAVGSLPSTLAALRQLVEDDPIQRRNVVELSQLATTKIEELRRTIEFERRDHQAALSVVRSDEGRLLMDNARRMIAEMRAREDSRLEKRTAKARGRFDLALWIDMGAVIGLLVLGFLIFSINRDIARREVLETRLRDAAAFQDQFVGILAHDLRNPLSAITLAARRIERAETLESAKTSSTRISSSAARMLRLADQLLDLTRARHVGSIPVEPQADTDLCEVTVGVVAELHAAYPQAVVDVAAHKPIRGTWDPDRLAQVISNLVANAILHGVGPVAVRVWNGGASAKLEVHNGGPAIPEAVLPGIFEAFHSGEEPGSQSGRLGLGLFIAERIVAAHGGKISARSTETEGTTFRIELPSGSS
jgi:signal transduction histidine kinase